MKNNKKGFTLVELVIVVAVMAILVAVAIPTISSISASANKSVQDTNARTIESMIKLAEAEADGATLADTVIDKALTAAKLGIEEGTYVYYPATGIVKYAGEGVTAAKGDFEIKFDGKGTVDTDSTKDTTIVVTEKK